MYDVAPGGPDARLQTTTRMNAYLAAHATLSDGIDAVTTTYVQPATLDPSDIRILSESGFVFKISTWLSTGISFIAHYDSKPAARRAPHRHGAEKRHHADAYDPCAGASVGPGGATRS